MRELPPTAGIRSVAGFCPMGCGPTLSLLCQDGWVTCTSPSCPAPCAVAEILANRETEHVVEIREDDFTLRHPLRERLGDALMDCDLHRQLAAGSGPPQPPGRYRIEVFTGRRLSTWSWTALP